MPALPFSLSRKTAWEAFVAEQLARDLAGPVLTIPGSVTKQAIIDARRRKRLPLFHEDDRALADGVVEANLGALLLEVIYASVPGVYLTQKKNARWRAYPSCPRIREVRGWKGKQVHLGYFATRAEAALEIIEWQRAGMPSAKEWRKMRKNENTQTVQSGDALKKCRRKRQPRHRYVTFRGKRKSVSGWARIQGIPQKVLYCRIFRYGWSIEQALTTPVQPHSAPVRALSLDRPR